AAQLKREQALGLEDWHFGQGQGIDAVGLGVAGEGKAKGVGLGRTDAVEEGGAAGGGNGDGAPCGGGVGPRHPPHGARPSARREGRLLQLEEADQAGPATATTDLAAVAAEHLGSVRGSDPKVDTDQTTFMHDVIPRSVAGGRLPTADEVTLLAGHGPTMVEP